MKEILDFLSKNRFGNLATCDHTIPDTRPMEAVFHTEEGIFFYTSTQEDLANQLKANQNICFCATDSEYNYVKVKGAVKFSEQVAHKKSIMEKSVFANKVFHESNLETMLVFYLPSETAMMHLHNRNELKTASF